MNIERYETYSGDDDLIFTFVSKGKSDIIKVVRYDRESIIYTDINGNSFEAYNLGFGDKYANSYSINDLARSNNGDMYVVFNTVLHTIPIFLNKRKNAAVHIRGADRTRHLAYHRFLNQRYNELIIAYTFYGILSGAVKTFVKGTIYDYIVVVKKMP